MSYYTGRAPYAPFGAPMRCFFEASAADMYDDDKLVEVTFDFTACGLSDGIEVQSVRMGDIVDVEIEVLGE